MADTSIRVPRASIAVTILHDPDYLELVDQPGGFAAFGVFTALLVAAKQQQNNGCFLRLPARGVAAVIGATPAELKDALGLIAIAAAANGNRPWVTESKQGIKIRKFEKWNTNDWGGPREGAGRPKKNQVIKTYSRRAPSSSSSSSSSSSLSSSQKTPHTPRKRGDSTTGVEELFDNWWGCYPRRQGKGKARVAYAKALQKIGEQELLNATSDFKVCVDKWSKEDHQFIPMPATWLNQERWSDDPGTWQRKEQHVQRKFRA